MTKRSTVALIGLFATILIASPSAAQPALTSADARKLVMTERTRIWRDPYSVRDARISDPHTCPSHALTSRNGQGNGIVCICVEANAKNAMGGYTGLTKTRLLIADRKVLDAQGPLGTAMPDQCGQFRPFPELGK